jgi:uncharacterized protein YbbK (DUF523 family)
MIVMISACLIGTKCRYDGKSSKNLQLLELLKGFILVPFCPEQLGGLSIPRPKAEIKEGRVINEFGEDVTDYFLKGAKESLKIARRILPDIIILKSRSPSCGKGKIYDGNFSGKLIEGSGITCSILIENGFRVLSDEEFCSFF